MDTSFKNTSTAYRLILVAAGIIILISGTLLMPPGLTWTGLLVVIFTALLYDFPLIQSVPETTLIQVVTLGFGLVYGPVTAGWGAALGIALGYAIKQVQSGAFNSHRLDFKPVRLDAAFLFSIQMVPLILALNLTGWTRGIIAEPDLAGRIWPGSAFTILLFGLFHFWLFVIAQRLDPRRPANSVRNVLGLAVLIEALPLPFLLINLLAYPQIGVWSVATLVIITALIGIFINRANVARLDLERRILDLSTLNQVSQVLQSNLDLENLLGVIHVQVTQLLKVDNFYVALYSPGEQQIWYPLAVKHGSRQEWPARALMPDRLTDRVVNEGKSIFLTPRTEDDLDRTGLPASEETPVAWMGVPLVTPERTIGCLAVYSISHEVAFTNADLNLLTILSGQVSVAIENAMLLGQARQRARQLETLNHLSGLMTASLDLREVLEQVCRSVIQVGGCQRSAIFLVDPENGEVSLAHATGLSANFVRVNKHFSVAHNGRMRCLRTGRPVLVSSLKLSQLDPDYIESLEAEAIAAYAEFPLVTPDGRIGFLGVYFEAPHNFSAEETELLQTFASQAALAVSNARLYAHTDMALSRRAHQLSILESVGRELAAAINSERLFDMILNYALEFTNSTWGELSLYNPELRILDVKAARGYPDTRLVFTPKDGLAGRAAITRQLINIGDVRNEPDYVDRTGGKARSKLCAPLAHEGRVMGVLAVESERPNAFNSNDEAFISQLATQAAVAVVNAELYSETQRRLREQSILYLVTAHLVGAQPIDMVLQTLARSMSAAIQQKSSIGIYLLEERQQQYTSHYMVHSEVNPNCQLAEVIPCSELETAQSTQGKTAPLRLTSRKGHDLLGTCKDCQALVFPMVANQQRLGMALMHVPKEQVVHDEELQLLKTIVAQVSLSLQNALLFADVRHGRDRMAAVLNSVGEGILMMDTEGRIMLANEFILELTGLSRTEITNQRLCDLPEEALKALGYTFSEARSLTADMVGRTPKKTIQGSESMPDKVLERTTAPVLGQADQTIGWMIILRDITEENRLDQAREMITSTLIHDLRSPVGAVLSALEIVNTALPEERQEIVDQGLRVARNGATRVLGLVDSLLDIARLEAGKMELLLNPLDLGSLIANTTADLQPVASEYKINLKTEVAPGLPKVFADQGKITRVLSNLLDNALKFTPGGGDIVVSAQIYSMNEVVVRVSDTGPGVPPEYRDKIFERFTTVPGQRSRRRGSGLGLTFCKMAVEAHGGRMWMEARPEQEKGSIFAFTLPKLAGGKAGTGQVASGEDAPD
jgi:PAS domain S-box-containing protein